MTRRRRLIFAGALIVAALTVVIWKASTPSEPSYDGRKLSVWLDEFLQFPVNQMVDPNTSQVQAVRAMGTNAIPWLLYQLRPSSSTWQWKLNQLLNRQQVIKFRFADIHQRLSRGTVGFWALGEMGESAIPALLDLVEVHPENVPSALTGMGRPAIPALQQCLANTRLFTNSAGVYDVAGYTIARINYAARIGIFPKSSLPNFLPTIEGWAQQSTNQQAKSEAQFFLENVGRVR
jgi:hypothetical protein